MIIYDKEMLVIMHAVAKWRPYLIGRCFQIKVDYKSLKYFLEQKISSPEQQKWVTKLLGYDYEITYKKGKENVVADTLSRLPEQAEFLAVSLSTSDFLNDIKREWQEDLKTSKIIKKIGGSTKLCGSLQLGLKRIALLWTHYTCVKFYLHLHEQILDRVIPNAGH